MKSDEIFMILKIYLIINTIINIIYYSFHGYCKILVHLRNFYKVLTKFIENAKPYCNL